MVRSLNFEVCGSQPYLQKVRREQETICQPAQLSVILGKKNRIERKDSVIPLFYLDVLGLWSRSSHNKQLQGPPQRHSLAKPRRLPVGSPCSSLTASNLQSMSRLSCSFWAPHYRPPLAMIPNKISTGIATLWKKISSLTAICFKVLFSDIYSNPVVPSGQINYINYKTVPWG